MKVIENGKKLKKGMTLERKIETVIRADGDSIQTVKKVVHFEKPTEYSIIDYTKNAGCSTGIFYDDLEKDITRKEYSNYLKQSKK